MAALTGALLALTAAKTISDFTGQRKAAAGAQSQGNYEGSLFDLNAGVADQQAADAIARGGEAVGRSQAATRQLTGSQRAAQAASGVDIGAGSPSDVIANDQTLGEFDAISIKQNAQREAWGYQVQAANDRAQGNLARMGGRNQAISLRNQSFGTLLNGAADMYNIYDSFGKTSKPSKPSAGAAPRGPSASNGGYRSGTAGR